MISLSNFQVASAVPEYKWDIPDYCNNVLNPPPFPRLSHQFSSQLEVSNVKTKETVQYVLYYDEMNSRLRFDLYHATGRNSTWLFADKYLLVETFEQDQVCKESPVTANSTFANNGKLPSVEQMFAIYNVSNQQITYLGVKTVRGTSSHCWRRTWQFNAGPSNYTIGVTHYFAIQSWKFRIKNETTLTPVRYVFFL